MKTNMYNVLEVSTRENLQIEFTQNKKHFLRDLYINQGKVLCIQIFHFEIH